MSHVESSPPGEPTPDPTGMPSTSPPSYPPPAAFPPPGGTAYPPPSYPPPSFGQPSYPPPGGPGYPSPTYPSSGYPTQVMPTQGYQPPGPGYPVQQPYPYAGQGYPSPVAHPATVAPSNTSAIILLVIAILSILATGIIGPPSAVMAIMSMKRNSTDPARAARLATNGWIAFAINAVLGMFAIVWLFWWLANR